MATVFSAGPDTVAQAFMGQPSQSVMGMIAASAQNFVQYLQHSAPDIVQGFQSAVSALSNGEAARKHDALLNQIRACFKPNGFVHLNDIGDLQNAPTEMLNVLMAHPKLQQLYQDGSVHGYGERYSYPSSAPQGMFNPNYQKATQGMLTDYHEDGTWQLKVWNNLEEVPLSIVDKSRVLQGFKLIDAAIQEGIDPTDPWNNLIG